MPGSEAEPEERTGELTPVEALRAAVNAHRAGDLDVAEAVYRRVLAVLPEMPDALHFYGVLHHQRGRPLEAIRLIRRAIEIDPEDPGKHVNLGNVFLEIDRPDLAMQAYRMTIVMNPGHVGARNNLGVALRAMRRVEEAEEVYREAVALDPQHRDSWSNLGRLLASTGRLAEAAECHLRALELEPGHERSRRDLVSAFGAVKETDRAMLILRDWLADEPDNPMGRHLLAAFSGEEVPERASDGYVETLFDDFAASFDHKLASLGYRAPELVAGLVAEAYADRRAELDILDAGCGTGLCAPHLRPFASRLTGVDLSRGMLEKAAARGGYDELRQAELTEYLRGRTGAHDVIVSADTLCYFGALGPALAAAAGALRPGGRLIFSVEEELGPEGFRLHPHGRYCHREDYVRAALHEAGFGVASLHREQLRMERGEPVTGLVVAAVRTG
ncbi:tetratricopeptide repeat protein [Enterovirga aerilata]|uniref:Tetratricopeptide repeat protein n=1 Tax=Enterovirga aerilata TaxID=2730920 RepID=A0A849IAT4_9HYPH|nr:tetratricopeptide repeat protein [Enterovirga sp. DB1703]NNM73365.1 tetratricopeptide repeat protein [Enterovirga sp. DB1703]